MLAKNSRLALLLVCAAVLGCAGATQNVRAYRAYAYEEPKLAVALDRVDDLSATLELVDRILTRTPYEPGADWVRKLPLGNREAAKIKSQLRRSKPYSNYKYEIPVIKVYRVHLERVMQDVPEGPVGSSTNAPSDGEEPRGDDEESRRTAPLDRSLIGMQPEEIVLEEEEDEGEENDEKPDEPADSEGSPDEDAEEAASEGSRAEEAETSTESYPSLLDALATLTPDAKDVRALWSTYLERTDALIDAEREEDVIASKYKGRPLFAELPPDLKEAKEKTSAAEDAVEETEEQLERRVAAIRSQATLSGAKGQIAKDAVTAVSVLTRIQLEALALVPIVSVQLVRSLPKAAKGGVSSESVSNIGSLTDLPSKVSNIETQMTRHIAVLEPLNAALAAGMRVRPDETPGFDYGESAVDQIAGVTMDSLRVNAAAGVDAFFYSSLASEERRSSDDGSFNVDYTGRSFKMVYAVDPIVLAAVGLKVNLDWIQLPDAAGLNVGFATDRVFKSGGTIEQGSLGEQLGVSGLASDALSIGLALVGIRTAVRLATFTAGEAQIVDATTDQVVATAPLQFSFTQVDLGYDLSFLMGDDAGKYYIEELVVGGRYFNYSLPRILYELRNTSSNPDVKNYVFNREAPAQKVPSKFYMAGVVARAGPGEAPALSPFFDLSLYFGGGPTEYYFPIDPAQPDVPQNREVFTSSSIAVDLGFGLGARWRLFRTGSRFSVNLEGAYRAELIGSQLSTSAGESEEDERIVDFGSTDMFHGPEIAATGSF